MPTPFLFIGQNETIRVNLKVTPVRLHTFDVHGCVVLIIKNPTTGEVQLTHIDGNTDLSFVDAQLRGASLKNLQISLIKNQGELYQKVLEELKKRGAQDIAVSDSEQVTVNETGVHRGVYKPMENTPNQDRMKKGSEQEQQEEDELRRYWQCKLQMAIRQLTNLAVPNRKDSIPQQLTLDNESHLLKIDRNILETAKSITNPDTNKANLSFNVANSIATKIALDQFDECLIYLGIKEESVINSSNNSSQPVTNYSQILQTLPHLSCYEPSQNPHLHSECYNLFKRSLEDDKADLFSEDYAVFFLGNSITHTIIRKGGFHLEEAQELENLWVEKVMQDKNTWWRAPFQGFYHFLSSKNKEKLFFDYIFPQLQNLCEDIHSSNNSKKAKIIMELANKHQKELEGFLKYIRNDPLLFNYFESNEKSPIFSDLLSQRDDNEDIKVAAEYLEKLGGQIFIPTFLAYVKNSVKNPRSSYGSFFSEENISTVLTEIRNNQQDKDNCAASYEGIHSLVIECFDYTNQFSNHDKKEKVESQLVDYYLQMVNSLVKLDSYLLRHEFIEKVVSFLCNSTKSGKFLWELLPEDTRQTLARVNSAPQQFNTATTMAMRH